MIPLPHPFLFTFPFPIILSSLIFVNFQVSCQFQALNTLFIIGDTQNAPSLSVHIQRKANFFWLTLCILYFGHLLSRPDPDSIKHFYETNYSMCSNCHSYTIFCNIKKIVFPQIFNRLHFKTSPVVSKCPVLYA